MKRLAPLALVPLVAGAVAVPVATAQRASSSAADDDIVAIAAKDPRFSTLVSLIKKAGLADELSGTTKLTVFAPTNKAFAKLPKSTLAKVAADKDLLTSILTYHVVPGQILPDAIDGDQTTVQGGTVTVTGSGDNIKVNDANVICGGVHTANATVYLIDSVLMPPA